MSIGEVAEEAGRWESERNESSFVSLLFFLTKQIYKITSCAWLPASVSQCFNQLTNCHKIWYERSATGSYCNLVPSDVPNALQSVIEKWQLLKTEPWTYTWQCVKQYANLYKVTRVKNFRSPFLWKVLPSGQLKQQILNSVQDTPFLWILYKVFFIVYIYKEVSQKLF